MEEKSKNFEQADNTKNLNKIECYIDTNFLKNFANNYIKKYCKEIDN